MKTVCHYAVKFMMNITHDPDITQVFAYIPESLYTFFTAALVMIASCWNQSTCLSTVQEISSYILT